MMLPGNPSVSNINSIIIINRAAACLPLRPSVCLSVRPSAGRFRKPSPARHGTGLSPSSSVCHKRSRAKLRLRDGGKNGKKTAERETKKGELRERKRYSQSSTRPLRCSLSLPHSLYMSLYQSRSLLLPLRCDVKLYATDASASRRFFQNKTRK